MFSSIMLGGKTTQIGVVIILGLFLCGSTTPAWAGSAAEKELAGVKDKSNVLLDKAYDQMLKGDFETAFRTELQAVRANRDSVAARRYLCYALLRMRAPNEALDQLSKLVHMTKPTALDLDMVGQAYLQMGLVPWARYFFQGSIELDPNDSVAKTGLEQCVAAGRRHAEAVRVAIDAAGGRQPDVTAVTGADLSGQAGQAQAGSKSAPGAQSPKPYLSNNQVINNWKEFTGLERK